MVVWLLRELTKNFEDLWVKIVDGDGEFLLIEAAGTLPKWLEPEVAENRVILPTLFTMAMVANAIVQVWIHGGGLSIIKPKNDTKSLKKQLEEKLSLSDASQIILSQPKRFLHSASIEEEAFYRLRNYPQQIADNMHHALVTLPRKIAFLVHQKPAYIAPAIEAFYLRDPIALKPLQMKKNDKIIFQPEDLVTVTVKFPRVGYAQLKSQDFPAPAIWTAKMPAASDSSASKHAVTGMKVSCGFEMLLSDAHYQDKPAVREMKMTLEDLDTGDETLPTNEKIAAWERREDDETWLDISFDDLEGELAGKGRKKDTKRGDFGDKAAQENLQRIVAQFEDFLNDDKAGPEGAGLFDEKSDDDIDGEDDSAEDSDSAGEDKEASFDEDEFTKMMREMMGMPSEVMEELMNAGVKEKASSSSARQTPRPGVGSSRVEELDSDESGEEGEMEEMMKRMEAELNETGVLNLDPTPRKIGATKAAIEGKGKAAQSNKEDSDNTDSSDDGEENDVDINLARNLLESFKSQAGMAGPGGNLMGLMGLNMPRDEKQQDSI